jgi:hypothetical protein
VRSGRNGTLKRKSLIQAGDVERVVPDVATIHGQVHDTKPPSNFIYIFQIKRIKTLGALHRCGEWLPINSSLGRWRAGGRSGQAVRRVSAIVELLFAARVAIIIGK